MSGRGAAAVVSARRGKVIMGDLPAVMPAAVYRAKGNVVVEERPVPVPEPDQVLLEVSYCGICGSDIHILLEGWGDTPGLIAGHEYTGTIVALGRDVEGWEIGDRSSVARPRGAGIAAAASRASHPSAKTAGARPVTSVTAPSLATSSCGRLRSSASPRA